MRFGQCGGGRFLSSCFWNLSSFNRYLMEWRKRGDWQKNQTDIKLSVSWSNHRNTQLSGTPLRSAAHAICWEKEAGNKTTILEKNFEVQIFLYNSWELAITGKLWLRNYLTTCKILSFYRSFSSCFLLTWRRHWPMPTLLSFTFRQKYSDGPVCRERSLIGG
jgi:hypothetical protein